MLVINSREDYPDTDSYSDMLNRDGYICFDKEGFASEARYKRAKVLTEQTLALDVMERDSMGKYCSLRKDDIFGYLLDTWNVDEKKITSRKTGNYSLDKKTVIGPLMHRNIAVEFFEHYNAQQTIKMIAGKMDSIVSFSNKSAGEANDGTPLSMLEFSANIQKNLRFNYKDFDIISQVPKEAAHFIGAPKGYCLVWGDFAQSDFRIAYNLLLRSPENDQLMGMYEDKYEALARMIYRNEGKTFDYDKFIEQRKLYKRLTLATMYGTRGSYDNDEDVFIRQLTQFLHTCKGYSTYEDRVRKQVNAGVPITIESYFGFEQIAPTLYNANDTINNCLNMPLQTGTSEIVIITVQKIIQALRNMGMTEDDARVYMVRHDEPIFLVKTECLDRAALVFKNASYIQVDDWTPLKLDFSAGYWYSITDETLQGVLDSTEVPNTPYEKPEHRDYMPIPGIKSVLACANSYPDKVITLAYGEPDCSAISTFSYVDTGEAKMFDVFLSTVFTDEAIAKLKEQNIRFVDLQFPGTSMKINYKGIFFNVHSGGMAPIQYVNIRTLGRYLYDKNQGVEPTVNVTKEMYEMVKGIPEYGIG